ncbi:sulfotransferase family 2 domain-containing protein [Marinobacter sp. chi1]|uniref:Sulfotransferase family 2 domain-containing protein n=1 Tax=Marinobacter suaedae TaxID=3057675 RepID=A0ABT8W4N8_9GAMM|nr:sulfotransferase family 2 domain-containing protein [Marinobacter sp. chi1]MDO3723208.1 sulfotransferase family 2 domain-containing protein [Marinobacter sp. chi1]
MIICHKYRFIFLKTSKTAGSSIEMALSKFCGPEDIVTPLSKEEDLQRVEAGGVAPQNYGEMPFRYKPSQIWKVISRSKPPCRYYDHIPARKVRRRIGVDVWNSYYKFCVARNPWDRVISQYYWRQRNAEKMMSIDEFLESSHIRSLVRKGMGIYTIGGKVVVDKICRYENLVDDLETVRQHLSLPEPILLPKAKSTHRQDKRHYSEVFTREQNEKIRSIFKAEIELLNYEY